MGVAGGKRRPHDSPMSTRRVPVLTLLRVLGLVTLFTGFARALAVTPPLVYTFFATRSMSTDRTAHTATLLANGTVLVAGGFSNSPNKTFDTAEIYDPATALWTPTGPMTKPRSGHSAFLLPTGKVLVVDGFTADLYDPAQGTWSSTAPQLRSRSDSTATQLADGRVMVCGGSYSVNGDPVDLTTAEIYDFTTSSWQYTGTMKGARRNHAATLLSTGKVLISGGETGFTYIFQSIVGPELTYGHHATLRSTELFDPDKQTWTSGPDMVTDHWNHSLTADANGGALCMGGNSFAIVSGQEIFKSSAKGSSWSFTAAIPRDPYAGSPVLLADGQLLATGAGTLGPYTPDNPTVTGLGNLYNPVKNTWTQAGIMIRPRNGHTATLLPGHQVLIVGGNDYITHKTTAEAEIYDAPRTLGGNFTGLVTAQTGTTASNATEGAFAATVQKTGAFTGRLTLNGRVFAVSGALDEHGVARFGRTKAFVTTLVAPSPGKPTVALEFHLDLTVPSSQISLLGTVTQTYRGAPVAVSTLSADQAYFDGKTASTTVPGTYLGVNNADGSYNLILPAKDVTAQPPGYTTAGYPQGTGFGTVKISKAGKITLAAQLADGTAVTLATTLARHYTAPMLSFPVFAPLYGKLGFISTRVILDRTNAESDLSLGTGALHWSRPFMKSQYYPYGWPEVIATGLSGSKFWPVNLKSVLTPPLLNELPPDRGKGNVLLTMTQGNLAAPLTWGLTVNSAEKISNHRINYNSLTLTINHANGQFSGTFGDDRGAKPAFRGLVYQKGALAGGHGYFLSAAPRVIDYTGQSGQVALIPQTVVP